MDCSLSYCSKLSSSLPSQSLPVPVRTTSSISFLSRSSGNFGFNVPTTNRRRPLVVTVGATSGSQCGEYSGLNTPLEPKSNAGSILSGVLLNDRECFHELAKKVLEQLADDRRDAAERMNLSSGSDEAFLHRRIAELKESECGAAVEDVMYMLICHRFHGIGVHMLPQISKCIYNNRLEIWPSKDWELESIHSFEVLEMIKEHLTSLVGWKANSSVTDTWATTQVSRFQLCGVYTASVLYGYLIKSAYLRLNLEGLSHINAADVVSTRTSRHVFVPEAVLVGRNSLNDEVHYNQGKKKIQENLKYYLMGFDSETLQMCAKPKSKEAVRLIERHASALFGDDEEGTGALESNEIISTSFATVKRFVLEAIAFGSFLWEAEQYVKGIYELEDNL